MITVSARFLRRALIAVAGSVVLLIGLALLVLPGPAIVVIPLGLGILALEFAWAGNILHGVRQRLAGLRAQAVDQRRPGGFLTIGKKEGGPGIANVLFFLAKVGVRMPGN